MPGCRKPDYLFRSKNNIAWLRSLKFEDCRDSVLHESLAEPDALAERQWMLRAGMVTIQASLSKRIAACG